MKSIPADAPPSHLSEVAPPRAAPPRAGQQPFAWARVLVWILVLLVGVWAVAAGISVLIQHTRVKDRVTAHIAAQLGRPVEVGSYDFTLWGGPALEAQSVSVAEDPRFGREYFLRAESISLRLRWRSLLGGHFVIDTLSLARPSLNLVLNDAGDWNLAEWLPRPSTISGAGAPYPLPGSPTLHFRRIEIDGGRINFKRSDDKLPFALIGVTGGADTDFSGRWRIDATATPWRAAVPMQQVGMLHATGTVGGTSSRLRPAKLNVSWSDASLSDVLRLARADDYGIRGTLAASIDAATRDQDDAWTVRARVQLGELHRWDLALRPDNPSANVILESEWRPDGSSLDFTRVALEAPHSNVQLAGRISWGRPRLPLKQFAPPLYVEISESQVDAADLLSWLRAFHSGVADDASVQGVAAVRGVVSGWPARVANAIVSSDGVALTGGGLRRPVGLGEIQFRYDKGLFSLLPAELSFGTFNTNSEGTPGGTPESALRLESSAKPGRGVSNITRVSGSLSDVHDLLTAASALGWQLARAWDLAGPVRGDLRWQGAGFPWQAPPVGFIEWGAGHGTGSLRAPFLNLPIDAVRARLDFAPGSRRVTLASAEAFGAHWNGAFSRRSADSEWQFLLTADRVDAADLDRWLNPRWRESFLGRVFPFLNSRSSFADAVPENLRAAGRLRLARFNLASLSLNHLEGDMRMDGRAVDLENAVAQLGGGAIGGSFAAHLEAAPAYEANFHFSSVDLSSITDADPRLAGLFDGSASGEGTFRANGATRADLVASLDCKGRASIVRPLLHQIDLLSSLRDTVLRPGTSRLSSASADFSCARQSIRLENLLLDSADSSLEGSGTVDFNRNLSLTLRAAGASSPEYHLSGTLAAPEISVASAATRGRPR